MTHRAPEAGRDQLGHGAAEAALQRLVDEHGRALLATCRRICDDPQDAEDLVQETLLRAVRGWSDFEGRSDPRTWLHTIAVRAAIRMRRRRAGEPARMASLDELLPFGEPRIAVVADDQDDALQARIRTEARERVEAAIAALPDAFRLPVVLKEIAGLTVPEVAGILEVEEGTIRSRLHRARLRLRAAVDGALPRGERDAPPPAYPRQTCLDLLEAKQRALDLGVPFESDVICERCRSVFASLDLTRDACRDLAGDDVPEDLRRRLAASLAG